MEKVDRRGFFASIGAALLAPVLPLKEKWVFNRSHVLPMQLIKGGKANFATIYAPMTPSAIRFVENNITTGLSMNSAQFMGEKVCGYSSPKLEVDIIKDPFQSFQINTDEVI